MAAHPTDSADVVVVGGGHNGLVCAAYLARAGLSVIVVDKNARVGGALISAELDGARVDLGAVEHTTVLTTGVIDELDLGSAGLTYRTRRVAGVHMFGDGTTIEIGETAEQTAESIAAVDAHDAEAWMRLVALSKPLMTTLGAAGKGVMPSMATLTRLAKLTLPTSSRPLVALANQSVLEMASQWFRSPYMRALAISRAGFAGLPPWQAGTAAVFCFTTGGHGRAFGRPIGGSRAFVEALVRRVELDGGSVAGGFAVSSIVREADGWSVHAGDRRTVQARRAVVSAVPPQLALLDLLQPPELLPGKVGARLHQAEVLVDNTSQLTLTASLSGLPPSPVSDEYLASTLWLLPDPDTPLHAYEAARAGRLPERIGTLLTFPSLMDPSLVSGADSGVAHTMWANSFVAADVGGGWDATRAAAAELVWRTIESCLPGTRALAISERLTDPEALEAYTGARNPGNHVAPIPSQMLRDRPARGLGRRTPIDGFYLTGCGTHPGGGVSGGPGRATAQAVIADLTTSAPARAVATVRAVTAQLATAAQAWSQTRSSRA